MRDKIAVNDLFEGAYLLIRGFELDHLDIQDSRGRKVVTFTLTGHDIDGAAKDYKTGKATANVKQLKTTVDHLKDLMFHQIRKSELNQLTRENLRVPLRAQGEQHHVHNQYP